MKKTIVLGASTNPERYSHKATLALQKSEIEVVPVGIKKGSINGIEIQDTSTIPTNIHTLSLYLGPKNQEQYFDFIRSVNPKRIILNPGTENDVIKQQFKNLEVEEACTLVLLATNTY